jgi:hypothetical protein
MGGGRLLRLLMNKRETAELGRMSQRKSAEWQLITNIKWLKAAWRRHRTLGMARSGHCERSAALPAKSMDCHDTISCGIRVASIYIHIRCSW